MSAEHRPVISFDLDGVVMQNAWNDGIEPRILEHLRNSPALLDLHPDEADRRGRAAIRGEWDRLATAGEWVALYDWDSIYTSVSRSMGGEPAPDVAGLVEYFCGVEGMVRLLPGARTGLERLRDDGFSIVAITNGYHKYQWPVLTALGVAEYFERVITPDTAGYAKPDARLFASVPGLRAHVGDSLVWDILGANQAGVIAVWLDEELPAALRTLPIELRTSNDTFPHHVAEVLDKTLWRRYHPEATPEACRPDAVVVDLDEAAEVLSRRLGTRI
jgi:FMN phosphatase YigB (HAD superfamily)